MQLNLLGIRLLGVLGFVAIVRNKRLGRMVGDVGVGIRDQAVFGIDLAVEGFAEGFFHLLEAIVEGIGGVDGNGHHQDAGGILGTLGKKDAGTDPGVVDIQRHGALGKLHGEAPLGIKVGLPGFGSG